MKRRSSLFLLAFAFTALSCAAQGRTAASTKAVESEKLDVFRRENLLAWCIVPFDAAARDAEARARMLAKLGIFHFAFDYRAEHVPFFVAEVESCRRNGIEMDAWWFPSEMNDEARQTLAVCDRLGIRPQLWVGLENRESERNLSQIERVHHVADRLRPVVEAAAQHDMKVGLYNHGGWCGMPENLLAIRDQLAAPNVGIVYNLMHAHAEIDRFDESLRLMQPHLLAINLSGMNRDGDQTGQKHLQLGQGELDLQLLRSIVSSGYQGRIGIVGHTQDDAELRLMDNLDGLDWLNAQLHGITERPRPVPRTPIPPRLVSSQPFLSRRRLIGGAFLVIGLLAFVAYIVVRRKRSEFRMTVD